MPKLYSYVVHHDTGLAPCIAGGLCTLAICKYKKKHKNIQELAENGDWVVGTGGADLRLSAGHGRLVYAMRVEESMSLSDYCTDPRFRSRPDARLALHRLDDPARCALVSRHFYYFGRSGVEIPAEFLTNPLEKRGPGYRCDFLPNYIDNFLHWLETSHTPGIHGQPCCKHI